MRRLVWLWLVLIALLISIIVVVGGATRLTDSGLSITEWQLIVGVVPPLSEAAWLEAFDAYREIPEYQQINRGMSLDAFKSIYWWEWAHRFLGRFVGVAFFAPFVVFWFLGALEGLKAKLSVALILGGAQGALGWYMVQSGLVDRVDVSQYRLAAHLGLAFALFGYILWIIFGLGSKNKPARLNSAGPKLALCVAALVFMQIVLGAFVAGLDAGLGYNTWPLMDERWVPDGLFEMRPLWANLFENSITVQFNHRMLAYVILLAALVQATWLWRKDAHAAMRRSSVLVLVAVLVQAGVGIATLLNQVPLSLGLAHQFVALAVWGLALQHVHKALYQGAE